MAAQAELAIGLDIGGTKMAFVVADRGGQVHERLTMASCADQSFERCADRIAEQLNRLLASSPSISGIGIGLPGPVDSQRGIAIHAANLGWRDLPVAAAIASRLSRDLPITIANDVNAGAIGEQRYGRARGMASFVYLTIGTGVGGAVMLDNRLLHGASASEMEIGHVSLDPVNGRTCACGGRGCLEMSVSGKGLLAHARQDLATQPGTALTNETLSTRAIIAAAERGDPLAGHVLAEAAEALGIACAWCVNLFNPPMLILGGGLIRACWHLLQQPTLEAARSRCLPLNFEAASIQLSELADGALGASALVWHHHKEASP